MSLEGELDVRIEWDGRVVRRVRVASTRPAVADRLLAGRTSGEVQAMVPRIFSICSRSQGAAANLACEAAAGCAPREDRLAAVRGEVAAEMVREYAWRALIDWPQMVDEETDAAGMRLVQELIPPDLRELSREASDRIAERVFGMSAQAWLAMTRLTTLDDWLSAATTTSARMLASLRFSDAGFGQSDVALLPPIDSVAATTRLAAILEHDEQFGRTPHWRGQPAETGALTRRTDDALVAEIVAAFGRSAFARFVARLRDLAALLTGATGPKAGAAILGENRGVAWVENARGLLMHHVQFADGAVTRYRIVAPTEWNFHPDGALVRGLAGTHFPGETDLRRRAKLLVQSLDPCVTCRVEIEHA